MVRGGGSWKLGSSLFPRELDSVWECRKFLTTLANSLLTRTNLLYRLAYSELYIALTSLVLRVFPRLQLYDTTLRDVEYDHDLGVPIPATENGVKVKIV